MTTKMGLPLLSDISQAASKSSVQPSGALEMFLPAALALVAAGLHGATCGKATAAARAIANANLDEIRVPMINAPKVGELDSWGVR